LLETTTAVTATAATTTATAATPTIMFFLQYLKEFLLSV